MSLLVSKRLGINVPPNICLVNVSPEPIEPSQVYQRSRLRKQRFSSPPMILAQRRRSRKASRIERNRSTPSVSFTPGSFTVPGGDTDDNSNFSPRSKGNDFQTSKQSSYSDGVTEDTSDNTTLIKMDSPDIIDNRLYKRNRSASIQIRSQTQNARKVVDALAGSFQKKRKSKLNKMMGTDERETQQQETQTRTRKISVEWFAKSITNKRMSFLKEAGAALNDSQLQLTGFQRFRRAARKVKNLIQVCQVCKSITLDQVSGEDWFAKMESIIDSSDEMLSKPQGPSHTRPFITFVQDKESKQLVQLTFDKSLFTRERRADYLLTDTIRNLLKTPANDRTVDEENELLMFMKRAAPSFNEYPLEAQRKLLKCMHYDKYEKDRVITRKNLMADGVYFILSGTLVEQTDDKKSLREMKPGERFGDEDIVCGCPRKVTVVTHSDVELMTIHRLDYRTIVHMADDSNDPKYLEICKEDIVFRHFPMRKLIENPGVWTVLSYKYGRLMVKDSNELEWIYIIKSGEAKVMKHLKAGKMDLAQRRKKVQKKIDEADPHAIQKKMIDFVSERGYLKSQYKVGKYQPKISPRYARYIQSAPSSDQCSNEDLIISLPESPTSLYISKTPDVRPATTSSRVSFSVPKEFPKAANLGKLSRRNTSANIDTPTSDYDDMQLAVDEVPRIEVEPASARTDDETPITDEQRTLEGTPYNGSPSPSNDTPQSPRRENMHITIVDNKATSKKRTAYINTSSMKDDVKFPSIPLTRKGSRTSLHHEDRKSSKLVTVPPFVQLESLHAGKVFGLRSVLDPSERGPTASLISGGCEVLQINKKFFMKHIDDAIISLIKVQYKPFPTEDELIDRLDNNFQWQEYKQNTVADFLVRKGRITEEQSHNNDLTLAS